MYNQSILTSLNFYDLGCVVQVIRQWDRTIILTNQGVEVQIIGHNLRLGDNQMVDKHLSLLFED